MDAPALRARAAAATYRGHVAAINQVARGQEADRQVDRTELSKNIVRGLAAYRELLATGRNGIGRVLHLAFAYPSRSAIPSTAPHRAGEAIAQEIVEEFRTPELAAGFSVGTATAWRYVTETMALLAAPSPRLRRARTRPGRQGTPT